MPRAPILYVSIILLWGFTWIAMKISVKTVAPEANILYRFVIAAVILFPIALFKKHTFKFSLKQHFKLAILGTLLFSCNFVFFYHASKFLTSGLVAIVFSTSVIMIMLNNAIFFNQKPSATMIMGAIIGVCGLCFIFYPELQAFDLNMQSLKGVILGLCGSYCFSWGNVISSECSKDRLPLISSTCVAMIYGCCLMLGTIWLGSIPLTFEPTLSYTLALTYLAIPGSVIGFLAYLSLVERIGPQQASYATLFFPIVALISSTLFESFHWVAEDFIGIVMVLSGNALVLIKPKKSSAKVIEPEMA